MRKDLRVVHAGERKVMMLEKTQRESRSWTEEELEELGTIADAKFDAVHVGRSTEAEVDNKGLADAKCVRSKSTEGKPSSTWLLDAMRLESCQSSIRKYTNNMRKDLRGVHAGERKVMMLEKTQRESRSWTEEELEELGTIADAKFDAVRGNWMPIWTPAMDPVYYFLLPLPVPSLVLLML
ncbi:hypothetical protein VKT23_020688 [Stygiomarasmius scandens]|uniref:Uncharacterized protein n=1 Tax=Marasmiellus scandens TaxID=2682957 RepID=A0ABR1IJS5_9AGAR